MKQNLNTFDEHYTYKDYVLVNDVYEDDDHRANTWFWGKHVDGFIENAQLLKGLSSNSYAPWAEVLNVFKKTVDNQ